jgi:predicted nucleic-acid-binding protein
MVGIDTNVLVRYLTHDDAGQTVAATRVINSLSPDSPGFLPLIVIAELVWVLTISYRYPKNEVQLVLESLLRSKELMIERAEIVSQALRAFRTGRADFADYLVERCAHSAGCEFTITFDREAATVGGMRMLR